MAAAAAVAAILAIATGHVIRVLTPEPIGPWNMLLYGYLAFPLVLPSAFVSGVIVWHYLPASIPRFGSVAGIVATGGTYLLGVTIASTTIAIGAAITGMVTLSKALGLFFVYFIGIGAVAVVFTFWVTVPLGGLAGYVHECTCEQSAR
jgi:hypothetical protein